MFSSLAQYGCSETFESPWQYVVFMNDLWEALRNSKDVAAQVIAEEGQKKPSFVGPARTVVETLGRAYAKARGATIWGEKTPGHLVWLPQIHRLFPEARILLTIRDPRDVVLSYDDWWGRGRRDTEYLMQASAQVRHYLQHLLRPVPYAREQLLTVRYEELVSRPEKVTRSICEFLGVPFEPAMLEFYRCAPSGHQNAGDGDHHKLLRQPVTSGRVGRYRIEFSPAQIELIEQFLGDDLRLHGYLADSDGRRSLTAQERSWLQEGVRRYELMRRGSVRRKIVLRARARLMIFRWLTTMLPWAFSRLATTSAHWAVRGGGALQAGERRADALSLRQ